MTTRVISSAIPLLITVLALVAFIVGRITYTEFMVTAIFFSLNAHHVITTRKNP